MMNRTPVFAYGSLVNRGARTREVSAIPAFLVGWARQWMHCIETSHGKLCALTVAEKAYTRIEGALLFYDSRSLAELDQREIGYLRTTVSVRIPARPGQEQIIQSWIYTSDQEYRRPGNAEFPIWRSYLDTVLAGYLRLGGRDALLSFVASTECWDTPILDDRYSPKYPRAVSLSESDLAEIDDVLEKAGLLSYLSNAPR